MRVLIAAGGTGGHIMPAIAVAAELVALCPDIKIDFVGVGRPAEKSIIGKAGYPLHTLESLPVLGRGLIGILKAGVSFPASVYRAIKLVRELKPDVVIGFGGYPAVMPLFAAAYLGIPRVLQEQNVKVGLANKLLSLIAQRIFAAPGAYGFWKLGFGRSGQVTHLLNPVREEFRKLSAWKWPAATSKPRVLIVGGSLGARAINGAILDLVDAFRERGVELVHQTGAADYDKVVAAYQELDYQPARVTPFIEDIASEYDKAHLVICRAGAMTVSELIVAKRPAIFIPLSLARAHQRENAQFLADAGGAIIVDDGPDLPARLSPFLQGFLYYPEKPTKMVGVLEELCVELDAQSGKRIAEEVLRLGGLIPVESNQPR